MFGFQLVCGLIGAVCVALAIGGSAGFFVGSVLFAVAAGSAVLMDAVATAEDLEDEDL